MDRTPYLHCVVTPTWTASSSLHRRRCAPRGRAHGAANQSLSVTLCALTALRPTTTPSPQPTATPPPAPASARRSIPPTRSHVTTSLRFHQVALPFALPHRSSSTQPVHPLSYPLLFSPTRPARNPPALPEPQPHRTSPHSAVCPGNGT